LNGAAIDLIYSDFGNYIFTAGIDYNELIIIYY